MKYQSNQKYLCTLRLSCFKHMESKNRQNVIKELKYYKQYINMFQLFFLSYRNWYFAKKEKQNAKNDMRNCLYNITGKRNLYHSINLWESKEIIEDLNVFVICQKSKLISR